MSGATESSPSADLDNPLWRFSLAVYGTPGVERECLALQDSHGVDVNLLLCAAWTGARGWRLDRAAVDSLAAAIQPWHEGVVEPLRSARRAIKALGPSDPVINQLRASVAGAELQAERIAQATLFRCLQSMPDSAPNSDEPALEAPIRANIALVIARYAPALADDDRLSQAIVTASLAFASDRAE